jgi:hypothetical protein
MHKKRQKNINLSKHYCNNFSRSERASSSKADSDKKITQKHVNVDSSKTAEIQHEKRTVQFSKTQEFYPKETGKVVCTSPFNNVLLRTGKVLLCI